MDTQIVYTPYISKNNLPKIDIMDEIQPARAIIKKSQETPVEEQVVINPLPGAAEVPQIDWEDSSEDGKARAAKQYLMQNLGLTNDQASGLVGTFLSESNLNINAENAAEKAGKSPVVKSNQYGIGINQWTGDRHDNFTNWTSQHGNSLQSQLDFAIDEIKSKYPEFLEALRGAQDVDEATKYVYLMYTGGNHRNVNKNNVDRLVQNMNDQYNRRHIQLYGKASNSFERNQSRARGVLNVETGGTIKMSDSKPEPYKKMYNLEYNPFKSLN